MHGAELVRPDLAVLRLGPGDPVPSLPLRVALPGAGPDGGPGQPVAVHEVMEAEGGEPVVGLVLDRRVTVTFSLRIEMADDDAQTNWICKLFPRMCR